MSETVEGEVDYDLIIVGGGMVGASLAIALREFPLRIALVEAAAIDAEVQPSFDARAIALSHGSRVILESIGLWPALAEAGVSAIRRIEVSDRGHFGATRIDAAEEGLDAVGYVAEAAVLGRVLREALAADHQVDLICPARVSGFVAAGDYARVTVATDAGERQLTGRLVAAADGGRSALRDMVGGETFDLGYGQSAIIATVEGERPHHNVAYERFTDSGPLALLPCDPPRGSNVARSGHRWSLVWTARDHEVEELLALPDAEFLRRLEARFGRRVGRFLRIGQRNVYPLSLSYLKHAVRARLVFIGNAAHTIHPVGGQGFNLGLRDVAVLAEILADSLRAGGDIGAAEGLRGYGRWRRPDYYRVLAFTDGLVRLFSNRLPLLSAGRNLGMVAMDLIPPLRRLFTRQAMGNMGRLPRLARGLRL